MDQMEHEIMSWQSGTRKSCNDKQGEASAVRVRCWGQHWVFVLVQGLTDKVFEVGYTNVGTKAVSLF